MRFSVRNPSFGSTVREQGRAYMRDLERAAHVATDRASKRAQEAVRAKVRSVGLGRLASAVGQTSSLRRKKGTPFGVIFAKGGDESRAGGALEAYSQGALIRARNRQWLAFTTNAVPKTVGSGRARRRLTPELYRRSSLMTSLGPLEFRPISNNLALLVAKQVTLHPRTGRAKRAGPKPTRTRVTQAEVVVFVLIRVTRRAQRFDKDAIVAAEAARLPEDIAEAMADIDTRRNARL